MPRLPLCDTICTELGDDLHTRWRAGDGDTTLHTGGGGRRAGAPPSAAICRDDEAAARAACPGEWVGGIERVVLGESKEEVAGAGKRSVYLMNCAPVWGLRVDARPQRGDGGRVRRRAAVRGRAGAAARDLDGLGLDADALRLPAHPFSVFDGHGSAEVANYCRERIHVVLSEELRIQMGPRGGNLDISKKFSPLLIGK
uniref:protein-serine/threonine phosphatase n=1 Tax=Oryza meridionalis TaxID=40149 RepID=A0A0E0BZQ7_9ORYZ